VGKAKFNNSSNSYNTWIIADGAVNVIWIEDLNTVLDDNRILTLANGDRIPMTDSVKMMFEVETLVNAIVSRAGIIYDTDLDLDWAPVTEACVRKRPDPKRQGILLDLITKWIGVCKPTETGECFGFLSRNCTEVMKEGSFTPLFDGLTEGTDAAAVGGGGRDSGGYLKVDLEQIRFLCVV